MITLLNYESVSIELSIKSTIINRYELTRKKIYE